MKTKIKIDGKEYVYCYVKARGTSWSYGYFPESGMIEAKSKKRKPTKRKKMEERCDNLWADLIKKAWGGGCAVCGKSYQLNAHHIITRSNKQLRWDIKNGIALCPQHHTLSSRLSAHKTPDDFIAWFQKNYAATYDYLQSRKQEKPKKQDMDSMYEELKGKNYGK